ncbi:LolA family protein [Aurantiacibacter rhizosphaerae]|uniref:Outer membrane lipoprotein carrier protein LolA n=1 Tax=Aurantiacibacter rhizosphaerae TaxID=2691582 RepID=A0A844X9Y8_9SPHN|nr:outer membrane lipoprotein carrier protein LolA [Aurantiacibacter rhizosphaerae]MWV26562.1 outer membrane lipoprotein carrier protein LolA [Aurantiacibacter rhizosphaerae]
MNVLKNYLRKPALAAFAGAMAVALPATFSVAATPVAAQAQTDQLQRAAKALRGITTMRADFTQTDRLGNVIGGELTLKNPGKIRFEYSDDVNMLVVSNGSALSIIDYDVSQVERYPVGDSPLGALLNPDRDIRRYGKVQRGTGNGVVSIQVSDPDRPEFPAITLIFLEKASAPGGLELNSWVALDSQNQRTTVRLRNHRYGMSVSDGEFRFRDPRRSSRRPG